MKLKEIVTAYNRLEKVNVSKLSEGDASKILKARKAMRPHVNDYKAFLEDCQEKFKPENWDEIQTKIQQWQNEGEKTTLTEQERIDINKAIVSYQSAIDRTVKDEWEKEVELSVEKLSEGSDVKLMQENNWKPCELDELEMLF